jgi:lipopolysaccharide transport protein LptA/LPS export ABC transporter protein LptC
MRRERIRDVRRALVLILVAVTGAVVWSIRRPGSVPGKGAPASGAARGTTLGDVSLLRFREGNRQVEVKARAMTGRQGAAMRLEGCEVTLPYVAEERAETATIKADECLYEAGRERANFRGNVRVATSDGFELESATLDYRGDEGVVATADEVRFKRGRASGSGRGLEYRRDGDTVLLRENVKLRFEQEQGPPAEIEAASARLARPEGRAFLSGGVVVRQGDRELHSRDLLLHLTPDLKGIERAAAIEGVDLRIGAGVAMPGGAAPKGGEKRLRCRKLHVLLRPGGALAEAIAVNPATLEVLPGRGDPAEKRRLSSQILRFVFDEEGRLEALEATAHGGPKGLRTVLSAEPIGPKSTGRTWRSESRTLAARFDPASGELRRAELRGDFAYEEPGRKAWARRAVFDETASLLTLTGDARIVDAGQRSELRAGRIELGTQSQVVRAHESVRHTLQRGRGARGKALLGGEEPAVLASTEFDYDPATKTAHYSDGAVLRSGKDEVRAPTMVLEEPAEGQSRLTASGGVTSVLHPKPEKGKPKQAAAIEARSREMVYEEAAGRIVYTGDVQIRQGDILTSSPEAVVTLTEDGSDVERLTAGSPAEVRQGQRRATGERGTYTPKDETLVLVGEKVVLQDVDRQVVGRILIFQVGSDRIRVDGREEVRAEAVFKRKEPPKP